jgi:hypothetical protein
MHHAGMLRSDRNLTERLFSDGFIKVRKTGSSHGRFTNKKKKKQFTRRIACSTAVSCSPCPHGSCYGPTPLIDVCMSGILHAILLSAAAAAASLTASSGCAPAGRLDLPPRSIGLHPLLCVASGIACKYAVSSRSRSRSSSSSRSSSRCTG